MARKTILVALGGNAIKQANQKGTAEEQFANVYATCKTLVKLLEIGHRLVITHGNGPQAGSLLIQQEESVEQVPALPLDIVGAMTQGQIGYMFVQAMTNLLWRARMPISVVSIINQVLVDENDEDFNDPSKPVGPFYNKEEYEKIKKEKPTWLMKQVKPDNVEKRFRRVVPSPDPVRNVEYVAVRRMIENGIVVIASGGGGIPVKLDQDGNLKGVAAVIDKDLAGEKLAEIVGADILLILTDVDHAYIHYGEENQHKIGKISCRELEEIAAEGHFMAGSMAPKIKAAIRFIRYGGDRAIITSLEKAFDAINGQCGTEVLPDPLIIH